MASPFWRGTLLIAALSLAMPLPGSAAETYYRWRDEQNKLVVSDRPPSDPSIAYEVVTQNSSRIRRVAPGTGAVPAETQPRPGNEFEPEESMEAVRKNPESCNRARANLETLNTTARIRIRDEATGELRFLSEEDKETQRQKAQDIIRVHCEN